MPGREKHYQEGNGFIFVIPSESLLKTASLIEDNIEVHASRCPCCGDELHSGQIDYTDVERAALALLTLFEDGILMDKDGMVVKIKDALLALFEDDIEGSKVEKWLKKNEAHLYQKVWENEDYDYIEHDFWDTDHYLNRVGIALLALFEDGILMDKDGMVVKIKIFLKGTIDSDTFCSSCNEVYESQCEGHPVWSDDKSLLKTAEALFDLLLELKDA